MKRLLFVVALLIVLTGCSASPYDSDGSGSVLPPDHSHTAPEGDNVVAHDPAGYCGNTITTVRYEAMGEQGDRWEKSFWGSTSVGLTDFLRWLDYSGEVCRCLPEYYVRTEFGDSEYGVNLSLGYVRFEGKQTQLTKEQLEQLKVMIEEVKTGTGKDICSLPQAE